MTWTTLFIAFFLFDLFGAAFFACSFFGTIMLMDWLARKLP